jgi:hypothetical protein
MNIRRPLVGLAALAITISTGVFADEIYKWTAEDGTVHYEDRPSGKVSAEQLTLSYNRTNSEALQGRVEAGGEAEAARREARAEAEEDKRAAEEAQVAAEQKQAECDVHRAKLNEMRSSRRVYRKDEAGERVYLDEAQRAESLSATENFIKETCDT